MRRNVDHAWTDVSSVLARILIILGFSRDYTVSVESSMATGHESQRNLKAILKWSLAQQGDHDGTQETHVDVEVGI